MYVPSSVTDSGIAPSARIRQAPIRERAARALVLRRSLSHPGFEDGPVATIIEVPPGAALQDLVPRRGGDLGANHQEALLG